MIKFEEEIIEILNDRQFLVLPGLGALEVSYPDLSSVNDLDNIPKYISINGLIDHDVDEYLFNYISEKTGRNFEDINSNYQPFKEKLVERINSINPTVLQKDGKARIVSRNGYDFLNKPENSEIESTIESPAEVYNESEITTIEPEVDKNNVIDDTISKEESIEKNFSEESSEEPVYEEDSEEIKPKKKYLWAFVFGFLVSLCAYFYYNQAFLDKQILAFNQSNNKNVESNKDSAEVYRSINHYFLYAGFFNSEQKAIDLCKYFNENNIDTYVVQIDSLYAIKGDFIDENQSMLIREKIKRLSGLDSEIIVEDE